MQVSQHLSAFYLRRRRSSRFFFPHFYDLKTDESRPRPPQTLRTHVTHRYMQVHTRIIYSLTHTRVVFFHVKKDLPVGYYNNKKCFRGWKKKLKCLQGIYRLLRLFSKLLYLSLYLFIFCV